MKLRWLAAIGITKTLIYPFWVLHDNHIFWLSLVQFYYTGTTLSHHMYQRENCSNSVDSWFIYAKAHIIGMHSYYYKCILLWRWIPWITRDEDMKKGLKTTKTSFITICSYTIYNVFAYYITSQHNTSITYRQKAKVNACCLLIIPIISITKAEIYPSITFVL